MAARSSRFPRSLLSRVAAGKSGLPRGAAFVRLRLRAAAPGDLLPRSRESAKAPPPTLRVPAQGGGRAKLGSASPGATRAPPPPPGRGLGQPRRERGDQSCSRAESRGRSPLSAGGARAARGAALGAGPNQAVPARNGSGPPAPVPDLGPGPPESRIPERDLATAAPGAGPPRSPHRGSPAKQGPRPREAAAFRASKSRPGPPRLR
ncbi:basic salivary proline-rich protein 4-like, partial [Octodon degus]|uniref:Basic salivary proline-rich protein 4-like n=1 Tax=Octodon degus TaxID=10160 RepID=A0A6P6EHG9_OCTDE